MRNLGKSRRKNKVLGNKTVIFIGVAVLLLLSVALGKELLRRYEVNREVKQLESEIAELEQRNLDLDDLIDYFNTNSFTEKEARQKLGMQKQGETTVILTESQNANSPTGEQGIESNQNKSITNPQRWWQYFFSTN